MTRQGVHVDRIACSWLIRRFIDAEAVIRFVPGKGYLPKRGSCVSTCSTVNSPTRAIVAALRCCWPAPVIADPALQAIAEIVHDIDLKDGKFTREETTGIAHLIAGIAMANKDDEQRIAQGSSIFDNLYQYFRAKRG